MQRKINKNIYTHKYVQIHKFYHIYSVLQQTVKFLLEFLFKVIISGTGTPVCFRLKS